MLCACPPAGTVQLRAQLHCNLLQPSWDGLPGSKHDCPWIWRAQQQSTPASRGSHRAHLTFACMISPVQWLSAHIKFCCVRTSAISLQSIAASLAKLCVASLASSCIQNRQPTVKDSKACVMSVQPQGTPRGTVTSMCNSDVPSQAVYARFLMVVRRFRYIRLIKATLAAAEQAA